MMRQHHLIPQLSFGLVLANPQSWCQLDDGRLVPQTVRQWATDTDRGSGTRVEKRERE